jgi:hypothetical protein
MTRRLMVIALALTAVTLIPSLDVLAHEGHNHKVMGTVKSIQGEHLEVQTTDGKTSMFTITAETKIVRGTTAATLADVKVGERIVVIGTMGKAGTSAKAEDHSMMTVKEIHLAGASKTDTQ